MKKLIVEITKNMMFYAINGYRSIIYWICTFFPINNNKVFVNYFDGKGIGDHPKYIVKELLKMHPKMKIFWVYRGKKKNINDVTFIKPFSIKAIFHQATSKIWISSVRMPYYSVKRKNQFYFQTWHGGLAFKKIEKECEGALSSRYKKTCQHDSKMIDFWVSSNTDNTKLYKDYFWYIGGEILEVGSPRNDIFFNLSSRNIEELKEKFGLNGVKTVVYAPTFRKDNSFEAYDLDLKELIRKLEYSWGGSWKLIVRLHPRLSEKSSKFIAYDDKIIDGSKIEDIQELLAVTDLLITDYSSIALDYINTRKPVIIYASDIEEYKKDRDFHIKIEETPFPIATNQKELNAVIDEFDYETYSKKLQEFVDKIGFFDDGKASKKVATRICKLMEQSRNA